MRFWAMFGTRFTNLVLSTYIDGSCSVDRTNDSLVFPQWKGKCKVTVLSDVYFDVTTVWWLGRTHQIILGMFLIVFTLKCFNRTLSIYINANPSIHVGAWIYRMRIWTRSWDVFNAPTHFCFFWAKAYEYVLTFLYFFFFFFFFFNLHKS